jgi:hypothetical protein
MLLHPEIYFYATRPASLSPMRQRAIPTDYKI